MNEIVVCHQGTYELINGEERADDIAPYRSRRLADRWPTDRSITGGGQSADHHPNSFSVALPRLYVTILPFTGCYTNLLLDLFTGKFS
jgi:hypothetical protein